MTSRPLSVSLRRKTLLKPPSAILLILGRFCPIAWLAARCSSRGLNVTYLSFNCFSSLNLGSCQHWRCGRCDEDQAYIQRWDVFLKNESYCVGEWEDERHRATYIEDLDVLVQTEIGKLVTAIGLLSRDNIFKDISDGYQYCNQDRSRMGVIGMCTSM